MTDASLIALAFRPQRAERESSGRGLEGARKTRMWKKSDDGGERRRVIGGEKEKGEEEGEW